MSKVIQLLGDKNFWIPLEEKKQYEMLGFHHDTSKLLYIEDFTKLKCCPHPIVPDYIWKDNNLPKHSSGGARDFTLGDRNPDKSVYVLRSSHCAGVKVWRTRSFINIIEISDSMPAGQHLNFFYSIL